MKLRIRIPTRAQTWCSLLSLPEEVILLIFKFMTANELMSLRVVCSRLKQLIDDSPSLWMSVSFVGVWPSPKMLPLMRRAANLGNVEALIKLGLAHLYNEGISDNTDIGVNAIENGQLAAEFFSKAEMSHPSGAPFTWFFVRPPWAPSGVCCKSCVFSSMVELCSNSKVNKSMLYCVGKILSLHEDPLKKGESLDWLNNAARKGSCHAAFELWKLRFCTGSVEPYSRLQSLRELRDCAVAGHLDAQLTLALEYSRGNLGGVTKSKVAQFVRRFVLRSKPINSHKLFSFQTELNSTMRYILVDWLVEVAVMKDFPSQIVHIAVQCVDQYLMRRQVQRSELQLLGITCVLIAARFQGTDIVTIREAAWLTDGTYKYEEVVRMMGEVMSCIKGQVRVLTIPDYLNLFCSLAAADQKTECISGYVADLSILHTEFGRYSPAKMAASSVVLANAVQEVEIPWPPHVQELTGFGLSDLLECTMHLHQQCLLEDFPTDHWNVKLKAIKERYSDDRFMKVSEIKVPSNDALCRYFVPIVLHSLSEQQLCASNSNQSAVKRSELASHVTADDSLFNTSVGSLSESGYDGDMEDEGELMMDSTFTSEGLFDEFAEKNAVLNKQPRNSSFFNCDELMRASSTPSILHEAGQSGFDFEMLDVGNEPIPMDNEIHSASGFCVPVVLEADESETKPSSSIMLPRQPLRALANNNDSNIMSTVSAPLKSQQRSSTWRTRYTRSMHH